MIYIVTSIYKEAKPLIDRLNLSKVKTIKFEIFRTDDIILLISGKGKFRQACGISYLLANFEPSFSDLIIHIGLCKSNVYSDNIFFCNKVTEFETGNSFYPEMIFKLPFDDKQLITYNKLDKNFYRELSDLEGYGFYSAACIFFKAHQIYLIKISSNETENFNSIIENKLDIILKWATSVQNELKAYLFEFTNDEKIIIDEIIKNLQLTNTMQNEFYHYAKYYRLKHKNLNALDGFKSFHPTSKTERKMIFERIKQQLCL